MPLDPGQTYLGMTSLVRMTTASAATDDVPEFGMGDRIRKARRWRKNKFTQEDIATAIRQAGLNVSGQAVGHWESGKNDIAAEHRDIVAIAVALKTGLPREWILTGASTPKYGGPQGIVTVRSQRRVARPAILPRPLMWAA